MLHDHADIGPPWGRAQMIAIDQLPRWTAGRQAAYSCICVACSIESAGRHPSCAQCSCCCNVLTRKNDPGLLPDGVLRHLFPDEEAEVGAQARHERRAGRDAVAVEAVVVAAGLAPSHGGCQGLRLASKHGVGGRGRWSNRRRRTGADCFVRCSLVGRLARRVLKCENNIKLAAALVPVRRG